MRFMGGGKASSQSRLCELRSFSSSMCSQTTTMHENRRQTNYVQVSEHAKLRFQQRIDASEPFPAERIRDMLDRAAPTREQVDDGIGWAADGAILVTDSAQQVVRTVLRRTPGGEQR